MPLRPARYLAPFLALAVAALGGCYPANESVTLDGQLSTDGYALFKIHNERQQRDDVVVRILAPEEGATYVLFASFDEPRNVGWFAFDPKTRPRCASDLGPACEVDGFGHYVDAVTVTDDAQAEIALRHMACGCDGDRANRSWSVHYAVMRVERTGRAIPVTFEVDASKVRSFVERPDVRQLQ